MPRDPMILLSVRPRFAEALLAGTKTVEVRRRRAHIADGAICLLYASSPTRALVGAVRVESTVTDDPDALWDSYGDRMGLDRLEYDAYLAGAPSACGIVIAATTRFASDIRLPELRRRHDAFVTPQSYRFLRDHELPALLNGQLGQIDALRLRRSAPRTLFA